MVLITTLRHPSSPPARRVEVRPLAWESNFFGERMGALALVGADGDGELVARADGLADELRGALREAELDGYRHLALRIAAEDVPAIWAAERSGLRLMDVAVDLRRALSPATPTRSVAHPVRPGVPGDSSAMRAMTTGAFGLTRFALDPFFTDTQVDDFYATWATNLFTGMADAVLLAEIDAQPAGFVGCKLATDGSGEGRISLIATATAYQRRGVGRELVASALEWFTTAGCRLACVKTQAANYAAVTLYERAGFTVSQTELTFSTTLN